MFTFWQKTDILELTLAQTNYSEVKNFLGDIFDKNDFLEGLTSKL